MMRRLPAIAGALLLAGQAGAQGHFQYTYCYTDESRGPTNHFVFSAPFPALPEALPGESEEQANARQLNLYTQASDEFYRFLEATVGDQHEEPECYQIGAYLPDHSDSVAGAVERARLTMRGLSRDNRGDEPTYTDFVPSWAGSMTGGREAKPDTGGGGAILLDKGPTPAQQAAARQASAEAARAQAEAERQHVQTLQLRFDAQLAQEGARIREQVEAFRRDYDQRQAACKAGDAANCYAKASAQ